MLEEEISASSVEFTDEEAIIATYDGTNIKITYLNENNMIVYYNKNGELENDAQNNNNINIYNKYKDRIVSIVGVRMLELFDSIYQ